MRWRDNGGWRPYVSVGDRLANAKAHVAKIAKKAGRDPSPVVLTGRKIATTFWGKAWCDNLTSYSDYSNRLPRGATYVRNGSVVDLMIRPKTIEAFVAGSETYSIKIEIATLDKSAWNTIKQDCSASIDSLLDLLAGRFSEGVMQRLTRQKDGLFPSPGQIKMSCSCPDWSACCKHLAAVMYGIGARLDQQPELLFLLRDVDHQELVSHAVAKGNLDKELLSQTDSSLTGQDLGVIFGIELGTIDASPESAAPSSSKRRTRVANVAKPTRKAATIKVPKTSKDPPTMTRAPVPSKSKVSKAAQVKVANKRGSTKTATQDVKRKMTRATSKAKAKQP